MKNDPQDPEHDAPPSGRGAPNQDTTITQEEIDGVLDSFKRLVQAAADTGRDWKLVDALLRTMIELVLETQGDLFESDWSPTAEPNTTAEGAEPTVDKTAEPRGRLRPEYRLRLEAVVDSWSDDETADFLLIGTRQVRRRAQHGTLYHFRVNRKRRYPVWQFGRRSEVLGGVAEVGRSLPEAWPTERVYGFMTTRSPELRFLTPAQWLLTNRDPNQIVALINSSEGTSSGSR